MGDEGGVVRGDRDMVRMKRLVEPAPVALAGAGEPRRGCIVVLTFKAENFFTNDVPRDESGTMEATLVALALALASRDTVTSSGASAMGT